MACKSIQSLHHHPKHQKYYSFPSRRRHSIDCPPSSSLFHKLHTNPTSLSQSFSSSSVTFSLSSSIPTAPSTSQTISFDLLRQHLSSKNFRQADEETRRLLILLAGEASQKRGYVFFSEVQFISEADLRTIDELWRHYSDDKFGYSVQKRIWSKVSKDFTKFFLKVGWMKKLDTEVEQYNYRAFPNEFIWELNDEAPEGHLPLTNALRGTQLLNSVLSHPAFQGGDDDEVVDEAVEEKLNSLNARNSKPLSKTVFNADNTF